MHPSVCFSTPAEMSCSQKLTVEHEKYEELQQKYDLMQEEYKRQLKVSEESSCQTVAQLTQLYDAQLEDKAKVLAQVRRSCTICKTSLLSGGAKSAAPSTSNVLLPLTFRSVRTALGSRSASSRR